MTEKIFLHPCPECFLQEHVFAVSSHMHVANYCCNNWYLPSKASPFCFQGIAARKIEGCPVLWTCEIQGVQYMICTKKVGFSIHPRAKVRCHMALLKYSCGIRSGACRSVSPAKLQAPWLFACSQRKPTHVASFVQDSSVRGLFPRYKGNLT